MVGHTQGPWNYRELPEKDETTYYVSYWVDGPGLAPIADVKLNGDMALANARLIAAAPEMLEALELAKAWGFGGEHPDECFDPVDGVLHCQCGLYIVEAAIFTAKGGE